MMPKIAIQYVAYWSPEAAADIDACMESLEELVYDRERVVLIIVDNPSPHGTARPQLEASWMHSDRLPTIELIDTPVNGGFAGGHLQAYAYAKTWGADYLYLLNQDARVAPDTLTEVLQYALAHPAQPIVQSLIVSEQDHTQVDSYGNVMQYLGFGYQDPHAKSGWPHFYASGAGVLIRTNILEEIGGLFDPAYFMYHDDVDLSWRARLAGYDIGCARTSHVYHRYEFTRSITKFYWMERNRILTHFTHLALPTLVLELPLLVLMELGSCLYALKGGWLETRIRVYGFFLRPATWQWIRQRRRLIRSVRRVGDRELLRFMAPTIEAQAVMSPFLSYVVNPVLRVGYHVLRALVRW